MSRNELVDLTLHQHHETHAGGPERGPAKSQGIYEFAVAEWIAQEKGLI